MEEKTSEELGAELYSCTTWERFVQHVDFFRLNVKWWLIQRVRRMTCKHNTPQGRVWHHPEKFWRCGCCEAPLKEAQ